MADPEKAGEPAQQPAKTGPEPAVSPLPAVQELPLELTDMNWEHNVERNGRPVTVMFYSPTCPFCHQIEPSFRAYARDYRDSVLFARIDIMTNPWTAERYGIRSTPTFKFFCSGKPVQEMVGAVYPALLKKTVDEFLAGSGGCEKNSTDKNYEITGYG